MQLLTGITSFIPFYSGLSTKSKNDETGQMKRGKLVLFTLISAINK